MVWVLCVYIQWCLFITCCVLTSATQHLPLLERVIDQTVFQHVNKIIPSHSISCKIPPRLSSMRMTSSAPNRGRGALGLISFRFLCMRVFDLIVGATSFRVVMKWRHTPFKSMSSLSLYEVTKYTVATRHGVYSNCNCGKDCQPSESRVRVKQATSYGIFNPRHVSYLSRCDGVR